MRKFLISGLLTILTFTAFSQDVTVQTEYPSVVQNGQQFNITYQVNAGGGEFAVPSFKGFYKLMGPQTSYSSSTQIINGKWSQQTSYSYTYFLQALNAGKFVIPPAQFTLKNKTYYSDSIYIEVVSSGNAPQGNVQQGNNAVAEDVRVESGGDNMSVALLLGKKEVYLGEGILATVKIYTKQDLAGISEIKYPDFTGFMKADLETPALNSLQRENINGTSWGTGVIQQFLLYPQVTGEINIEPVQITVLVQQKSGVSDPFFGDFFSTYQTVQKAVVSKPVKINVKPLPGVKPENFSGVVGNMTLNASINKDSVNVNDAINLKLTVSGSGNLKLAEAPQIKLSPDIETYDPKITDNLKNSSAGTTGQKIFEYLLIPRHYGDYTIPSVTYSYFNTATGKFEQLKTNEFHFYARKGDEQNAGITVYGGVSKQDVKYVGKDIRFIKSEPGRLRKASNLIVSKRSFYSIYAIALLAFLGILFIRREHIRRNSDITAVKNRKAGKVAVKRLHEASACMKRGETDRFYEEILKALWGYLSDKLNIPVSDLTRSNAITALQDKNTGEDLIMELTGILDKCEYARYAPAAAATEIAAIYEGASRFISSIENTIS
ncbi:MAG: BatD family protein [Bacteroidia bacterium]|nr:BatD family protein [Bacteroidia bacterium]